MNILKTTAISLLVFIIGALGMYNYFPYEISSIGGEDMLGATITTINGSDKIKESRAVINTNFSNLNTDKLEISDFLASTTLSQVTSIPNLATIGTITTGTWNSDVLTVSYGGTGTSTLDSNEVLLGNGTSMLKTLNNGVEGQTLSISSGVPAWTTVSVNETQDYNWTGDNTFASTTITATGTIENLVTDSITPKNATTTINGDLSVTGEVNASLALEVIASENLKYSRDTEESTVNASYTEKARINVYFGGTYTIKFDLKGNANGLGYGKIYRNGVAYGTEQSQGNTAYATKSEDLVFAPGDTISLYIKGDGDSTASIENFRLYFDMTSTLTYGNTDL